MMPGDWTCPNCHDLVFARNATCRLCSTPRPDGGSAALASPRLPPSSATYTGPPGKGGAGASTYGGGTFASTTYNGPPAGGGAGTGYADMRAGDWHCPACFDLQFARNASCRRCGTLRPSAAPEPVAAQREAPSTAPESRSGDWHCPSCFDLQFARNARCRKCGTPRPHVGPGHVPTQLEMRPGDWMCPRCNDHVFAKNDWCRRCSTPRPSSSVAAPAVAASPTTYTPPDRSSSPGTQNGYGGMAASQGCGASGCATASSQMVRAGDWYCPACNDLQFARNTHCRRCGQPNPSGGGQATAGAGGYGGSFGAGGYGGGAGGYSSGGLEMRPGDWICPKCNDHVFAKNSACRRCNTPNPNQDASTEYAQAAYSKSQSVKPGDWYCPKCNDLQFARNAVCRLCSTPRPEETGAEYVTDDHRQRSRSPYRSG